MLEIDPQEHGYVLDQCRGISNNDLQFQLATFSNNQAITIRLTYTSETSY